MRFLFSKSFYRAVGELFGAFLLRFGSYGSVLLGLSAISLIWFGAFYFTNAEKTQTEEAALHNASNLARAFEEHIIRSVRTLDQALLYLRDAYARDPRDFDISAWARINGPLLRDVTVQAALIDAHGKMIASSVPGSAPGLDLSDREHFKVHLDGAPDELFISKPVLGRASNRWSIQLTRRINTSDGKFGGVAVLSLDPAYLAQFYESIDVGQKGSVALVGSDGVVRARGSNGPVATGASLIGSKLFEMFARAKAGSYATKSQLDGIARLFVYRAVRDYPLIVVVGLAEEEVFRSYESSRRTEIGIAALLTLWLLVVTLLLTKYQRVLAKARDDAEAGIRARSDFLAMMSHEIRTPMNGVIGMSELLLESGLTAEQVRYAHSMREAANHLLQIINDVLDFSKLEAERIEIEHIEFNLHEVVTNSVNALSPTARDKNLVLAVNIDPAVPPLVVGDPARLRQVLLNLVGNGLKFTTYGRVDVLLTSSPGEAGSRITFKVADTGIGIPKDGIPLLFREFSQLDRSIARRFGGTGLGLAICKRLIDLMGGSISVESEVGNGTTFLFTIEYPIANAASTVFKDEDILKIQSPKLVPEDGPAVGRPRILVVEDNATNMLVVTKLLFGLGHTVDTACNGIEAVEACKRNKYDIVFMDLMMPEMDGLAATRLIRKLQSPFCEPFIIALTANVQNEDRKLCHEAGMNDFLTKPVTRTALSAALARFGGKHLAEEKPAPSRVVEDFDFAVYAELATVLGTEDVKIVVESFLSDTVKRLAVMRANARGGDKRAIQREIHATKSSSGTLGLKRLSELAQGLERDVLGLAWPDLDARLDEIEAAFDDSTAILGKALPELAKHQTN